MKETPKSLGLFSQVPSYLLTALLPITLILAANVVYVWYKAGRPPVWTFFQATILSWVRAVSGS